MRRTTRYPVSGESSLWNVYKTVSFWKVMKNFIIIQIARYTPFFIRQKLVVPHIFADESRKENIVCAYGNAGYYVPRKDNCGRQFDYWL